MGEAAIENTQRVLLKGIKKNLKKVTSKVKVRSKVKIVIFASSAPDMGLITDANQNFAKVKKVEGNDEEGNI